MRASTRHLLKGLSSRDPIHFHHRSRTEIDAESYEMLRRSILAGDRAQPPPGPRAAQIFPLSPSPPWPAERTRRADATQKRKATTELTLFLEILELYLAAACFHHGSSTKKEMVLQMCLVRPGDDSRLLQNAGRGPERLNLEATRRATPPSHPQAAAPPETRRRGARSTEQTLKTGERDASRFVRGVALVKE